MSLKNVAVLAAFLQIDSIIEALPAAAERLCVSDFDIEKYKTIASSLSGTSVVGLEKFISVFGGGAKKKVLIRFLLPNIYFRTRTRLVRNVLQAKTMLRGRRRTSPS